MMVDFESKRIFKSEDTRDAEKAGRSFPDQSRLSHTIALIDMPGAHFDPNYIALGKIEAANAAKTKALLSNCEALIVCIDCSVLNFHSPDDHQKENNSYITRVIGEIIDVINKIDRNTRLSGNSERMIPITLALTKFDIVINHFGGNRQKANTHVASIFDTIGLEAISSRNPNVWVMACPVYLVAPDREIEVFRPENIELPFLYSTMAALLSKAWHSHQAALAAKKEQARVKAMPFWSWLFSSEVNSIIHGRIAERGRIAAATEWEMARAIYESLCLQQYIEPSRIRSGRMGREENLCDMTISGKLDD